MNSASHSSSSGLYPKNSNCRENNFLFILLQTKVSNLIKNRGATQTMEILTPKKYLNLLYRCFNKVISFEKEIEQWSVKKKINIALQTFFYNFLVGLSCIAVINMISSTSTCFFQFHFEDAVIGVTFMVIVGAIIGLSAAISGGIARIYILGLAAGFSGGIALGFTFGLLKGVAGTTAVGVITGAAVGAVVGIAVGITAQIREFSGGVTGGVAGGAILGVGFGAASTIQSGIIIAVIIAVSSIFGKIFEKRSGKTINKITFGVCLGVTLGVALGQALGIPGGVVCFFSFWAAAFRLWHLPYLFLSSPSLSKHLIVKDENIVFSLPFLTKLLRNNVDRRGVEYTRELITFIIENRSALQKQAQDALVFITFASMQEITAIKDFSNYSYLRDNYEKSLSILGKIAYELEKNYKSENLSNRLNIYKDIVKEITDQKRDNLWKKSKFTTEFSKAAEIWKNIVSNKIEEIEKSSGLPLPNPFIVGKPVKGKAFISRDDIIEEIKNESLRDAHTGGIIFLGNRRTGKSSTLLNLNEYLPSSLKSIYFDFQNPQLFSSIKAFCKKIANETEKSLNIRPEDEINNLSDLSSYFETVQNKISQEQIRLLICFDEFEKMTEKILAGKLDGLADSLRHWIQHLDNFVFLFACGNEIYEIDGFDWSDYLINLRTIRISYFDYNQSRYLMTKPVSNFDLKYHDEKLLENFIKRMGGHPYLIQAAMYNLTTLLNNDNNRKTADEADINSAVEKTFSSTEAYFHHFWETELGKGMRIEIIRLAENKELENKQVIRRLLEKEFIRKTEDGYEFCVPVVKEWIKAKKLQRPL